MTDNFDMPKDGPEALAFNTCIDRACALEASLVEVPRRRMDWLMDFAAVNHSCPMDWGRMADAADGDFVHDAFGIRRHLDRDSTSPTAGQLLDCFLPRFALPELPA